MAKTNLHVPDYLILPFGRAVKSDLQKINLSAVSADGLYFSTDVPIIFIRKADKRPMSIGEFENHFGLVPDCKPNSDPEMDQMVLDHICAILKSHNPNMTQSEERFLDLYFGILKTLAAAFPFGEYEEGKARIQLEAFADADEKIGLPYGWARPYHNKSATDVWRALLPIPELQLYVQDPLAETVSYQPDNNFRVDYGFWDGTKLTAVELDGAEPEGYAKDIRRDRLLKRAGVEVIHILNVELARHKARALAQLLPRSFFGFDWDYEGNRLFPAGCPF